MTNNQEQSVLEQYKELVKKNKAEISGIQPVLLKNININDKNSINLKVFDSLNIGSNSKNTCNINQLLKHVELVKNNPDCYVILGGNLFYCFDKKESMGNTTFDTEKQLDILEQIFSPIKDKIIGIVSGKNELAIQGKEGVDPTKLLARRLNLEKNYNANGIVLSLTFKNKYTNNKPQTLDISCSSIYTTAQLYATIYKRGLQAGKRIGSADINITTGTHRCLKADSKVHDYSSKGGDIIRKPHYEYNSSGYCMWGKKGEGPYFIDNNMLSIYIAKNKDAEITQGTNEIKEIEYKVFCDLEPIEKTEFSKKEYSLIADYYAVRKHNEELIDSMINSLTDLKSKLQDNAKKSLYEALKTIKEQEKGE